MKEYKEIIVKNNIRGHMDRLKRPKSALPYPRDED